MEPSMTHSNLIQKLQNRGLIAQITNQKVLTNLLSQKSIALYCGFDPTGDSLHIGHLLLLLCLKRFQLDGHKPIILIGGATGMIGDPSFKSIERKLNSEQTVKKWVKKINKQISRFLDFNCESNSAIITNNYSWFHSMNVLNFLREIGKHFSVNQMINKETVKQRLNRDGTGISFTEFSYSLLQGYDFANLNKEYGVVLQIGGSDQWGNIISGIDLTRRLYRNSVFGLTVPLITKADGTKFGKTEIGAICLNAEKTSPYKFYQFWINTSDEDVYRFLRLFTFMNLSSIASLEEEDRISGRSMRAKCLLADLVTDMVHGQTGLMSAKRITSNLFGNVNILDLTEDDLTQLAQDGLPSLKLTIGSSLQEALVESKFAPSKSQARTMISASAVTINGSKQNSYKYIFSKSDRLFGKYTLLCRGKKNYCLIHWK